MMTLPRRLGLGACTLALAGTVLVAGCGGDTGGVGVGGTGQTSTPVSVDSAPVAAVPVLVTGPITGFGSVIVNGLKFDDTMAAVLRDALSIANSNLRLGMTIEVTGTRNPDGLTGTANTIRVFSEIRGPVQSVQAAGNALTVLGVAISVDASTVFEGAPDLSGIKAGDAVEVYGLRNPSTGAVIATRIEVEPAGVSGNLIAVSLSGPISNLNATAKTFVLNAQTVDYSQAALTGTLSTGSTVQVLGSLPSGGGNVTASSVAVQASGALVEGRSMEFSGIVTDYVSRASFRINSIPVDASSTALSASEIAKLQNGVRCEVDGRVKNAVVVVSDIECHSGTSSATVYEVSGTITTFVSAANFTARNQVIDASAATFSGGQKADLALGKNVEVKGPVVGGILKASSVEFDH